MYNEIIVVNDSEYELLFSFDCAIDTYGKYSELEDKINLDDAGCISRLREILATTDNDTTRCKVLLALNNLALNETTITHFLV